MFNILLMMSDKVPLPNKDKEWTVYGAKWCGYCRAAKQYFTVNGIDFEYHDVDEYGGPPEVLKFLKKEKLVNEDYKTIPLCFNKLEFIGGWSDVKVHSSYLGKPKTEKKKPNNSEMYKKLYNDVKEKLHKDVSDIEVKMFMVSLKSEVKNINKKKRLKGLALTTKLRERFEEMSGKEIGEMWSFTEKKMMEKIRLKKEKAKEKADEKLKD